LPANTKKRSNRSYKLHLRSRKIFLAFFINKKKI
jgi:hypothetical protein